MNFLAVVFVSAVSKIGEWEPVRACPIPSPVPSRALEVFFRYSELDGEADAAI